MSKSKTKSKSAAKKVSKKPVNSSAASAAPRKSTRKPLKRDVKKVAKKKVEKPKVYVTTWCEYGEHEYERLQRRGRVPKACPEHIEAARLEAAVNPSLVTRRKRYVNQYSLVESKEPFVEGDEALFVPTSIFATEEKQLRYAKEVLIERVNAVEDKAWVVAKGAKQVLTTTLSKLRRYSVERVEVTNEPEEFEFEVADV